jgi:predicted transcriptional regulator
VVKEIYCETAPFRVHITTNIVMKGKPMAEPPTSPNVLGLTAQIVSAHVSNNPVSTEVLPTLIQDVYRTLASVGLEPAQKERPQQAVPVNKSVYHD